MSKDDDTAIVEIPSFWRHDLERARERRSKAPKKQCCSKYSYRVTNYFIQKIDFRNGSRGVARMLHQNDDQFDVGVHCVVALGSSQGGILQKNARSLSAPYSLPHVKLVFWEIEISVAKLHAHFRADAEESWYEIVRP